MVIVSIFSFLTSILILKSLALCNYLKWGNGTIVISDGQSLPQSRGGISHVFPFGPVINFAVLPWFLFSRDFRANFL